MNNTREIERTPKLPILSPQLIDLLNTLCFRQDDSPIPPVDCLFVFGTAVSFKELAERLKPLLEGKISPTLLITGGIEKYQDSQSSTRSEAERMFDELESMIPKDTHVYLEKASQNTLENILFGLKMLPKIPNSLCFVGKSYHMGRAYLTLKQHCPNATLYQCGFDPLFPGIETAFTKESWPKIPLFAGRMWGEFIRIKTYGERGDIHFEEVKELIKEIDSLASLS